MNFTTWYFPIFFISVWVVYRLLNRKLSTQNVWLTFASYVFYGAWDWRFLFLLWLSTFIDFHAAQRIARSDSEAGRRRWLGLSLIANLGILSLFKYFNFFIGSAAALTNAAGFHWNPELWNIVLPVGISFYTFQTLSYTIDVYRGHLRPCKRITDFALYVAFFPQLVAGPIERGTRLLPQIMEQRNHTWTRVVEGSWLILWGFFKKLVIADNLAGFVNDVYGGNAESGLDVLLATYAFAYQIYCDFSGYSDIARGLAKLLGFELMKNFDSPYLSASPSEFWRRWHISLSTWLRDYLYIPLGGNRGSSRATYRNLILTMLLGGLWHGAAWHFVLWGAYQGTILVSCRRLEQTTGRIGRFLTSSATGTLVVRRLLMFHLICFGWFLFRIDNVNTGMVLANRFWSVWSVSFYSVQCGVALLLSCAALWCVELWLQNEDDPRQCRGWNVVCGPVVTTLLLISIWGLGAVSESSFIYFQF